MTELRFAVNIEMWWKDLPLSERLEKTAALGFDAVEFWTWRDKDLEALSATARELGLQITQFTGWGFTPGMNHPDNESAAVEEITAACDAARAIDCRMLTVVAGDDQPGMTREAMHEQVIRTLRRAAPAAEAREVTLMLEPMNRRDHPGHCLYGSEAGLRICRAVDSPRVKLNWDLYHMQVEEGDLCLRLRESFDAVAYLQLADHPGRHEPGTGEIQYARVFREAMDLGYREPIGLECLPRDGEEAAARRIRETAKAAE